MSGPGPRGRERDRGRRALTLALLVAAAAAGWLAWSGLPGPVPPTARSDARAMPVPIATVRLDATASGVPVARSFIGLSMEYWGFARIAGGGAHPDPLLAPLVAGLASGGGPPTLRIGGRASDESWWNPRGRPRPPGVSFDITPRWLASLRGVVRASGARVLLGLNLALRRPRLAAAFARAARRALPRGALIGFEVGNEPDLYGHIAWYGVPRVARAGTPRRRFYARPPNYDVRRFTREFVRYAVAVRRATPHARFTGPGFSTPRWMPKLPAFLRRTHGLLAAVTYHRYPLRICHSPPVKATIAHLLDAAASDGLVAGIAPYVARARAHRLPFWVTELNSVACGGRRGVSNTFASALWGLETLLELAHAGVAGVDVHGRPDTSYAPFRLVRVHGRWRARVAPIYDALRLFAQLTPAGARVAQVAVASRFRIEAWSVREPGGRVRVVVIDEDPRARGAVRVEGAARGPAQLMRLDAPSLAATAPPSLGGQVYGADARLHGRPRTERIAPAGGGAYLVALRRPGVAVLTLP